jgi:hypothetical protein
MYLGDTHTLTPPVIYVAEGYSRCLKDRRWILTARIRILEFGLLTRASV